MEFRLLGPLEVSDGRGPISIPGRRQRALLARLLLDANRTVSADRLIDDLWGDEVPDTAAKMVQIAVSRLRKLLPDGTLLTSPPGYLVVANGESIDLARFRRLRAEGQELLDAGEAALAAERLRQALAVWRGPPLGEFAEPFAVLEAAHLEELRMACVEARVDADLACGRHDDLIGELEALAARNPLRARLRRQLVLALYRAGRHGDALARFAAYRAELVETVGIDPSAEMRELERRILQQDPALDLDNDRGPAPAGQPKAVRYVSSGDVSIAYDVVGDGPLDIVLVHGWVCSFHAGWERPQIASFYRRLAGLGRLILFDKRGTGLSDRVHGIASLEERMDDVRAVMDAVGSERALVIGISEGGPMVCLFAATYPERTIGLVTLGAYPRRMKAPDYPIGARREALWWARLRPEEWGGADFARRFLAERAPSIARDDDAVAWYASYFVRGASPSAVVQLGRMNSEIDVRQVLPTIHVPALVLHRERELFAAPSRYLGERIPGARIVALPGADHLPWEGDQEGPLREIEAFVEGIHDEPAHDRVLATVLVVRAADAEEACDLVRAVVARFRGRELELTGDLLIATFDGPARAIRCALSLADAARAMGTLARAGIHTGECDVVDGVLTGPPIQIARTLVDTVRPGEAVVSATVRDLVAGSGLAFTDRLPPDDVSPDGSRLFTVVPPAVPVAARA